MSTATMRTNRNGDDRAPPHSLDAERAVIGAILTDPSAAMPKVASLTPSSFHSEDHRRLFGHMVALWRGGKGAVDVTLLKATMESSGEWSNEISALIADLWRLSPAVALVEHHAATVRRLSECRQQIHVARDLLQSALRGEPGGGPIAREELRRITEHTGDIDYRPMSVAQLVAAKFDLRYLVSGILAAGQPCLVFGPQKTLKTSILLDLAVALALGGHFLGHFKVEESTRVAIMSGESGLPVIRETLLRIVGAAGYTADHLGNLIVTDQLPKFGQADHAEAMRRFVLDNELQVVIIDPAYMAMAASSQDAGNVFAQGELLRSMNEVFAELGATLILCHHAKKNTGADPYAPPELTNVAWSGFSEWARQWLMLGRRERYEPGTGLHRLWLSVGGSAGHSGSWALDIDEGPYHPDSPRRWEVVVSSPEEMRLATRDRRNEVKEAEQQARLDADVKKLVDALRQFPNGETANVLRARAGLSGTKFTAAMAALLQSKQATEVELTKPNRKLAYNGYRLTKDTTDPNE